MPTPSHLRIAALLLFTLGVLVITQDFPAERSLHSAASAGSGRKTALPPASKASDSLSTVPSDVACDPQSGPGDFAERVTAQRRLASAIEQSRAFDSWLTSWRRADAAGQDALAAAGGILASERRAALKDLIELDPKRALELAVPVGLRRELPPAVAAHLEDRVDNRGELEVSVWHRGASAQYDRVARIDGRTYRAFVFGRRATQATKSGLPMHGIAVDDALAVDELPYRMLDDADKAERGLALDTLALLVGSELASPTDGAELTALTAGLIAGESNQGPRVAKAPSVTADPSTPATAALTSPPSWINGTKRVLYLKIDFSDDAGAAFTDAEIQTGAAATNDYFVANSQGKTTFVASILPATLRMPKPKAYYETSGSTSGELYTAARDAAKAYDTANGGSGAWDPDKFDRYIIVHKRISVYLYGGVAQLGGARVGLNNTVGAGTTGHELGHTQSLAHSHYWLPSGTSPVGAGSHVEYGDIFDIMGGGGSIQHLNVAQKAKLGYLEAAAITTITSSGTYRIARHDDGAAAGVRALRVAPAGLGFEYWVEHRRVAPTSFNAAQQERLRNGVLVRWGPEKSPSFTSGQGSYLLDATPGSAGGANDAPLRIGESFVDPDSGITFKPVAVGGTAPHEYIDVQIGFGAVDGNRNPVLTAEAPASGIAARTNVALRANASDPDGDAVYYRWDFGDGSIQPNLAAISRRFPKGGIYSLRVSAHDGKGGIDVKTIPLTVTDPLTAWTQRTTGVSNNLYAAIYAGGKFVVAGDNGLTFSSIDGISWSRGSGIPTNHFPRAIAHSGTRFVTVGVPAVGAAVRATAAHSADGVTWTATTLPANTGSLSAVTYGAGRFVAVGESGRIYNSVDGASWSEVTSPVTTNLSAVAFADNLFVATGTSGRILTSADGASWTNRSVTTGNTINSVTRHRGSWYAAVSAFECFISTDGSSWSRVSTAGRTNSNNGQRLISAAGVLLSSTNAGGITFAEDPRKWSEHQINATPSTTLYGLAEGAGQIVVVGVRGLIYTTASVPASPILPAPSLRLEADSIKVDVGRKNVLAASGTGFTGLELYVNGAKVSEIAGSAGALPWTPPTVGNYLLTVRGVDAAGNSVVSAAYPAVAAFANWRWLNPGPVGADLRGAVRVDDKWWIVGGGGTLLTLDDGGNFSSVDFPTTQSLNAIAYANGRFVIATTDLDGGTKEDIGGLWTSSDGYAWTPFLTGVLDSANLNTALHAADRWIALGNGGVIVTSTDGVSWPRTSSGISNSIYGVTTGSGLIVAVAGGGKIITSTDGLIWTERTSGVTTDLRAVTFAEGTFVAVGLNGVILTSSSGAAWSRAASGVTANLYSVARVQGAFVAGGDGGTLLSSAGGTTWSNASLGGNATGTLFLASSGTDALLLGRSGDVYTGSGGANWQRRTRGTIEAVQGLTYANGRFVAVGAIADPVTKAALVPVQVSSDGLTWRRANANAGFSALSAVTFGQSRFVAVGPNSAVFVSTDGLTWTKGTVNATAALSCVAAGPAAFVAGSTGQALYSSTDGLAWSQRIGNFGGAVRGVAHGAGRFVAVGDGGNIRHSSDGIAWTAAASGVTTNLLAIGWWDDVGFIATGSGGAILGSTDGLVWRQLESGVGESLGAITRTPFGFVAAGGTQGTMLVSLDGISWAITSLPADKTVRALAFGHSTLIAAGDGGSVLAFDTGNNLPAPVISTQPVARAAAIGDSIRFSVVAQNAGGAVYQWLKDGDPIPGANSPVINLPAVAAKDAGTYAVTVTTASGSVTSTAASLSFGQPANPGRLVNLSILTSLASAEDDFRFGVVVGGSGTAGGKALLVRAVGPSLAAFGVGDALADPKMEFFTGTTKVGENDNWGGSAPIAGAMASVGAFPLAPANSRDAAISFSSLASGANSARIYGTGAGQVLAELYDATPTSQFTASTPRLVNVSVLKHIGSGVTAGFVIGGSSARRVLIRAIGPTLGAFGVEGTVADPRMTLFAGPTERGGNDNWGGGSSLAAAFTQVGAFALAPDSRDAALLVTLEPGNYTVQVSGAGGTTGVALIEVYEVP
ncbi:MAG: hypothetical protein RLZZ188_530 [Verrucomicrobiota bacterium]